MRTRTLALVVFTAAAVALLGATAARSTTQGPRLLPVDAGGVTSFAFDPADPGTIYVGTIPAHGTGRVYQSTDRGDHWRLITERRWTWLHTLAVDPKRPRTLYAGTGNALYKTTNGGVTWRAFTRGLLPPPGINRGEGWVVWLAVDPTNTNVLYEHDYAGTLRKSIDGGHTWKVVLSPRWIDGLLVTPGRRPALYAVFYISGPTRAKPPGVYRSRNGGKTWRKMRLPAPHGRPAASAADPQRNAIYIVEGARIFRSTDAGRDWNSMGQGLPQDQPVTSLAAGAGTVFASLGTDGIFKSLDGGRTWTRSWPASGPAPGLGSSYLVTVDPAHPATVFAEADYPDQRSTASHILRSTDGGRTWTVVG
jgi:photosystem II stability/assembly factor-like uncharacterized protein